MSKVCFNFKQSLNSLVDSPVIAQYRKIIEDNFKPLKASLVVDKDVNKPVLADEMKTWWVFSVFVLPRTGRRTLGCAPSIIPSHFRNQYLGLTISPQVCVPASIDMAAVMNFQLWSLVRAITSECVDHFSSIFNSFSYSGERKVEIAIQGC